MNCVIYTATAKNLRVMRQQALTLLSNLNVQLKRWRNGHDANHQTLQDVEPGGGS